MKYGFNFCHFYTYLLLFDDLTVFNFEYNLGI